MSTDQKIEASSLLVSTIKGVGEKLSSTLLKLGIKKDTSFDLTLNGQNEEEYMSKFEELISKDD